ncbi:hypothetical protein FXO37_17205 [Capsicum annuum]|nr:hypothetical protein FXO37_17205 [Capsicum annuum]
MSIKVAKRKHFQIENNGFSQSNQMDFQIDQQVSSDLGCYLKLSFAWLPVRSLLRFKCVSKYWDALISDPYFELKHRSSPESKSEKLLIRQRSTTQCGMLKFYSSSLSASENVQQLDSPLTYYVDHYELFASSDGLVLLKADTQLSLWNPSTKESALLSHADFNEEYSYFRIGL